MKVTVILIVVGALGMISKCLERTPEELEIRGRIKTIQTTELSEESWRPGETCCHSDSSERPPADASVKNLQGVK